MFINSLHKLKIFTGFLLLVLSVTACGSQKNNDSDAETVFSDPSAPIGNKTLTVPEVVSPILDVWMRDAFIMYGPDGNYYLTGTTASPDRVFPEGKVHCWDYNDGLYMWKSKDMKNWESMGLIWSFDADAADWQKKGKPLKAGAVSPNNDPLDSLYRAVWAPELHYIASQKKWMIIACLNGGGGSFILESISGLPQGPYVNIEGNAAKPIYENIDASLFEDDNGEVYVVAHNHYIAKMKPDLSDIAEPYRKFIEMPYDPEPYIEGVYMTKHDGKYQLLQTVWSVLKPDGDYTYVRDDRKDLKSLHSYDVVVAESDNIYGPYGPRYPAIIEGGHNNIFTDGNGDLWSSTFFNPRGTMGTRYPVTCRPAVVPVKWENGKLMPDSERANKFYSSYN
ncbi:family 43 glycosylhydrolase [Sphingobacterium phlebotomi]|uniref:Family 43 glycosylhydrolase n=2 Tax=Sphingobacterium phlebotomi TaxID=2605433 RepID=A0A5D4HBB4_9SPHI|nr:family 43 glycosylhydrolase [Sphingobacterium phlebotomi]